MNIEILLPNIRISTEKSNCSAPIDMPKQTLKSMKAKAYGSFTAVRNLITDKAPTSPKDKAKEDFTTAIIELTHINTKRRVFP